MFKAVVMARQACVIIHIYNRKDMKIGDKVRFLSEKGGGVVAGFQGKNVVLVEDEDGFQIPMAINDVVLVASENYDMGKVVSGKTAASSAPAPSGTSNRSVKALLDDGEEDVSMEVDDDPASREVTFRMPAEEREGGNKLSVYLAFAPLDIKEITKTRFESYIVNDCNYYIRFAYFTAEGNAWNLKAEGEVEPNTKLFIEDFGREDLGDMGHIAIQLMAYKREKSFILKPAVDVRFRIDPVKFYKLHTFTENDFFEQPALLYTIVENDELGQLVTMDADKLKRQMYKDKQLIVNTASKTKREENGEIVVDLHINELLDTTAGMSSAEILNYQMEVFRKTMKEYMNHKGQKIIFIHGKGEGVLRQAIIHELNYRYKRCPYQDASFREYGYGATQVTIK